MHVCVFVCVCEGDRHIYLLMPTSHLTIQAAALVEHVVTSCVVTVTRYHFTIDLENCPVAETWKFPEQSEQCYKVKHTSYLTNA